jgi:hypothetical protein
MERREFGTTTMVAESSGAGKLQKRLGLKALGVHYGA